MEQEIQSKLFRLSVLIATSLSTLTERIGPNIIDNSSSQLTIKPVNELTVQVLNDLKTLFGSVQKSCTNLTLALRPDSKQDDSQFKEKKSPIAGLDEASLTAAKAQITSLMENDIPKLVFLVQKAKSDAVYSHYVPKTKEDYEREKEEKEFVISKGGQYIIPSHARETEKLEKIRGKGLGKEWSESIKMSVFGLLESLGELSKAYMDEKTLKVLQKASLARDRREGILSGPMQTIANDAKAARQHALQSTAAVWNVCDTILKGKGKLPENNKEAVQSSWQRQADILEDALRELKEAIEDEGGQQEEAVDEDDPIAALESLGLTENQKSNAKLYIPFIESCIESHIKSGKSLFTSSDSEEVDFDDIKQAGESLSDAIDDLVASLLYGTEEQDEDIKEIGAEEDADIEDDYDVDGAKEDAIQALEALHDAAAYNKSISKQIEEDVNRTKELGNLL